jgi:peptidoglycan/xylan/chitin deacetylase (PgdA/CDA1 family)
VSSLRITLRRLAKLGLAALEAPLPRPPSPRLLIYHQVGAGLDREMEVTEQAFRRHVELTRRGRYRVVPLEEVLSGWNADNAERRLVFTFDDGYSDLYETAYPILRAADLPFVCYLATESIETGRSLGPPGQSDPLTWAQAEDMLAGGLLTVGAHTHSHVDLRDASRDRIEYEIGTSNDLIRDRLGVVPRHFAYPWGYWGPEAHDVVLRSYETAVLGGSPVWAHQSDPFRISRVPIQLSDGVIGFRSKLRRAGVVEERIRRRVTGYEGP